MAHAKTASRAGRTAHRRGFKALDFIILQIGFGISAIFGCWKGRCAVAASGVAVSLHRERRVATNRLLADFVRGGHDQVVSPGSKSFKSMRFRNVICAAEAFGIDCSSSLESRTGISDPDRLSW